MSDSSADRDPLDRLAEEFVDRFRCGERPSVAEFARRLPGREDEVVELFSALIELEQLKPGSLDRTADHVGPTAERGHPERVGDYRILRLVGRGGMGTVYEAIQESLGRHVALKLLPAEALADPRRLERFRREARAAARLHHTNIVPVFGVGEAEGRHFYAMQFIAGHPLDAVIEEVRRLKGAATPGPPSSRAASEVGVALATGGSGPPSAGRRPWNSGAGPGRRPRPSRTGPRPNPPSRAAWPTAAGTTRRPSPGSAPRPPTAWPTPTPRGSCTATSSRPT